MTITSAGIAVITIMLSSYALSPSKPPDVGSRVESDSFTNPTAITRCITYNINKKMPELLVRNRANDSLGGSIYLILTNKEQPPATFGVIRVDQSETGSHLTTWLPSKSLSAATSEIAQKLIAGC